MGGELNIEHEMELVELRLTRVQVRTLLYWWECSCLPAIHANRVIVRQLLNVIGDGDEQEQS